MAVAAQQLAGHALVEGIVLDQQDAQRAARGVATGAAGHGGDHRVVGDRQFDVTREGAAVAGLAADADLPPIMPTRRLLMLRPRPVPPKRRWSKMSAWVKASKISLSLSCGMPMPVSVTASSRRQSSGWLAGWHGQGADVMPPLSVNLMALPIRLSSTWRRRTGVADQGWRQIGIDAAIETQRVLGGRDEKSCSRLSRHSLSTGMFFRARDSRFDLGEIEMSLRISSRWSAEVRDFEDSRCFPAAGLVSRCSVMPMMPFIGVRISWLMLARNCDLAMLAASAASWPRSVRCAASKRR